MRANVMPASMRRTMNASRVEKDAWNARVQQIVDSVLRMLSTIQMGLAHAKMVTTWCRIFKSCSVRIALINVPLARMTMRIAWNVRGHSSMTMHQDNASARKGPSKQHRLHARIVWINARNAWMDPHARSVTRPTCGMELCVSWIAFKALIRMEPSVISVLTLVPAAWASLNALAARVT